jgi:hypothetical protein
MLMLIRFYIVFKDEEALRRARRAQEGQDVNAIYDTKLLE